MSAGQREECAEKEPANISGQSEEEVAQATLCLLQEVAELNATGVVETLEKDCLREIMAFEDCLPISESVTEDIALTEAFEVGLQEVKGFPRDEEQQPEEDCEDDIPGTVPCEMQNVLKPSLSRYRGALEVLSVELNALMGRDRWVRSEARQCCAVCW